jgi:hypothetical protein
MGWCMKGLRPERVKTPAEQLAEKRKDATRGRKALDCVACHKVIEKGFPVRFCDFPVASDFALFLLCDAPMHAGCATVTCGTNLCPSHVKKEAA